MKTMSISKDNMIAIMLGLIVFFVLTLFGSIIIAALYFWSVLLADPLHFNKWVLFFGTPGLLIWLFITHEKKCNRRKLKLARHLKEQHQINIQNVSAFTSSGRKQESFQSFIQILEPYEYTVIFQLFQDQIEALSLTGKCERIDKEIWTAKKADIMERLPELWDFISGHESLEFLIYAPGASPIDPVAFYKHSNPNNYGMGGGGEAVARGLWLSERPSQDMVSLVFGEDVDATVVYRQSTTIAVDEIMESVVQNLIQEEDRERMVYFSYGTGN